MVINCKRERKYEVIMDREIYIEDVNKLSIIDTERPEDYEYGYERIDKDHFKEYHKSERFAVCPHCGKISVLGELECNCTTYTIVTEKEVLEDVSIASREDHLRIVAYR